MISKSSPEGLKALAHSGQMATAHAGVKRADTAQRGEAARPGWPLLAQVAASGWFAKSKPGGRRTESRATMETPDRPLGPGRSAAAIPSPCCGQPPPSSRRHATIDRVVAAGAVAAVVAGQEQRGGGHLVGRAVAAGGDARGDRLFGRDLGSA